MGRRIFGELVAIVLAGAVVIAAARSGSDDRPAPDDVPARPADAFAMIVQRVVDGDTIRAVIGSPNGLVRTAESVPIRLIGVDAPELRPAPACGAIEATAHLARLLPVGATVWVGVDHETSDRYDRLLFYLWTADGRFVNHELVAAGDAEALVIPPNDAHHALLRAAEESARSARLGRWGSC